jgi:hypothetical protein
MWVKLAAQLSHRGQLAPTPPAHCVPLRNAMPGMAGVPAQPADPSVVPAARSRGPRLVAVRAKTAEPTCGYVDNAKNIAHITTGAASAEAFRFFACSGQ